MNKTDLIHKLKQLEGISQDEKAYLINLVNTKKKYGLVWEDKPEEVEEQLRHQLPIFKEVVEKRIQGKPLLKEKEDEQTLFANPDNQVNQSNQGSDNFPNHILIEGDNLHALTALTFTHEGKVDVMYFDPPYNTGNKDFKYNDTYVDKEDSYRHSKWLSFMEKRLKIAKSLLSEKGVIFISIDDNEQAQLKMLCDEIFGEENSIGPIIQNKQNAKNDTINIQKNHEFIIVYRKMIFFDLGNKIRPSLLNSEFNSKLVFKENDNFYYLNDSITTRGEGGILNSRPNLGHSIYFNPITKDIIAVCDYNIEIAKTSNDIEKVYRTDDSLTSNGYVVIRPPQVRGKLGCWTWSLDKINSEKENLIITGKPGSYSVKKRTFVKKEEVINIDNKLQHFTNNKGNSRSILEYSTNEGTELLSEVLGNFGKFNNPKNMEMLKYLLHLIPNQNSIVLDIFAGSGTTLHATIQLNKEDGGNRQCILVTNNENKICEEVTYERNKRVIQGYTNAKGIQVEGLTNNNLRYYQTGFVSRETSIKNKKELTKLATELLCIKEDCYQECSLEIMGNKVDWLSIYFNGGEQYFCVIYDDNKIEEGVAAIELLIENKQPNQQIKVYVFSNGQYPYTEEFEDVLPYITLCALPDAIYKAYQQVLPKRLRKVIPELEETTPQNLGEIDLFNPLKP